MPSNTEQRRFPAFVSPKNCAVETGLSLATIWRRQKDGRFPAFVQISAKRKAARGEELAEWVKSPATWTAKGAT